MKRTMVVFSVLAALLLALTATYAVEHSTWGRIKANFVGVSPKETADPPQWLTYKTSPRLAKTAGDDDDCVEKLIKADKGGKLILGEIEEVKLTLTIEAGSLSEDVIISMSLPEDGTLTFELGEGGIVFEPHGTVFLKPAKLRIESNSIDLSGIESVEIYTWDEVNEIWVFVGEVKVEVNERNGTVTLTAYLDHFSRYALGGSR